MESTAKQRYIIMSPRKIRRVANAVRGKQVIEAYNVLNLMPYFAARVVLKKLVEAVNNARVKYNAEPAQLYINRIMVDEGPAYRRFKPRAQGRVYRREKPTAHLMVSVKALAKTGDTAAGTSQEAESKE